ncbi:UbiA prenyltransferase family protein [Roseibacillus ishigakijimensis]|uniref:UbiA prenyltransferase family protein n=1 Tax=Roseibacillus ishigakijimensis TaxID=454146 RepID=A0A934VLT8_9BACT|nr:UbiA prenyltransferase family protein [Roseibacillus ishigakijimensis]MBK1833431.1 UbiA prenyltransferase family protein [Roseibacillus ishigakijimensis]
MAALFFAGKAGDLASWWQVLPVLVAFSALASAGYLWNDVLNREEDGRHPRKRHRPVASGLLPGRQVLLLSGLLALGGLGCLWTAYGDELASRPACWSGAAYLGLTASYSAFFRGWPFVDVLTLAVGFVLRVAAGAYALGLEPTGWLMGCTYAMALLLGFGKRLGEWRLLEHRGRPVGETRPALRGYSEGLLKTLVGSCCLAVGGLYLAYCLSQPNREILMVSVLPASVGLLSYLRLAWRSESVEAPEKLLFQSSLLAGSVIAFGLLILFIGIW